jgi:hypothetical protein
VGQTRVTPVAVIGMGCWLAGGDNSPELSWEALLPGEPPGDDLIREVPYERRDVADFDPKFLGITFCGVNSAVLTSKAVLGKCPDTVCGSMEAPLKTIRGARTSPGYRTNGDLLRDLEDKWSE